MKISKSVSNRELKSPVSFLSLSSFDLTKLRPNRPLFGLPKLLKPDLKKNSQNTINTSWKPIETVSLSAISAMYSCNILEAQWTSNFTTGCCSFSCTPVGWYLAAFNSSCRYWALGSMNPWVLCLWKQRLTYRQFIIGYFRRYPYLLNQCNQCYPHLAWLSLNMGYPEITWFVRWTIFGCTLVSNIPKYRSMSYCWLSMVISYEISPSSAWYIIDISPFADISS